MRDFTDQRGAETPDQLWLVEHDPVFTQGLAGRPEHLLAPAGIPVVQTDRGGQVTYHGPGQLVVYPLLDLDRRRLGIRCLVEQLEQAVIDVLAAHALTGRRRAGMPGVYIGEDKIASIGLKVRRGRCYHGLAFNVAMDLAPFAMINPCGYAGLKMTQLSDQGIDLGLEQAGVEMASALCRLLDYHPVWTDSIRDEN
ncbi:MAG: lipoyl(octanoyl) transferase LipB [Wenzhouxiangella sp.]